MRGREHKVAVHHVVVVNVWSMIVLCKFSSLDKNVTTRSHLDYSTCRLHVKREGGEISRFDTVEDEGRAEKRVPRGLMHDARCITLLVDYSLYYLITPMIQAQLRLGI